MAAAVYVVVTLLCVSHSSMAAAVYVAVTLLGIFRAAQAQVYGAGACPEYQTSDAFNLQHISDLVERGGVVPYLSSGTITERYQSCQYLRLQDGGVFTYTYKDV
ncbi:uncharacterized protein LOC108679745, partial [Hyalella azteca]|uniref:Uncharacterized protein LOC108679745 n=1 Tax=Hyalella azteca TaxID=294128 RepID=A0A8B7PD78_HYAAZ